MRVNGVRGTSAGCVETMRDPDRIPRIIKKLKKVWKMHPDYRLGQLVSNLQGPGVQDVFFMEDEVWEDILEHLIE